MTIEQKSSANLRRKFLVKGSAVALISSLPLKASWATYSNGNGCSVSGNLSGNLSRECDTAKLYGKSPAKWLYMLSDSEKNEKWKTVFGWNRNPMGRGHTKYSKIGDILRDNDIDAALLAAYFNARYGHYGTLTVTAQEYACGLYDQIAYGEVLESEMFTAIRSTY